MPSGQQCRDHNAATEGESDQGSGAVLELGAPIHSVFDFLLEFARVYAKLVTFFTNFLFYLMMFPMMS